MFLMTRGKGKRSPRMVAQIQTKVSSANRSSKVERGFPRARISDSPKSELQLEEAKRLIEQCMNRYANTLRELAK
jgi:hypothetical protein